MHKPRQPLGAALHLGVALAALAGIGAVVIIAAPSAPSASSAGTARTVNREHLVGFLLEIGVEPGTLAAASVTPPQAAALVATARDHYLSRAQEITAARRAVVTQRRDVAALELAASTGTASVQQLTDLPSRYAALAAATAGLVALHDEARAVILAGLSQEQRDALAAIRASGARDVPLAYRTVVRADPEWVSLRDALIQARVDAEEGLQASPAASMVDSARRESRVATAIQGLAPENAAGLSQAWNSAIGNEP